MPQVIAGALVGVGFSAGVASAIGSVVTIIGLNIVSTKLFGPKIPKGSSLGEQTIMTRSGTEYRQVVYGQAPVSGPIFYNNKNRPDDDEYVWFAIACADGESDDLVEVWFDDEVIAAGQIDWDPQTLIGSGDVSQPRFVGDNGALAAAVWAYLGSEDQLVSAPLDVAFHQIDASHRARGVTWLLARFRYNADTEQVWQRLPPQNIVPVWRGRKVYDRRRFALNEDPDFDMAALFGQTADPARHRWFGDSSQLTALAQTMSVNAGVLSCTDTLTGIGWNVFSERSPVDQEKVYTVRVDGIQVTGDQRNYIGVVFYDANGDVISATSSPVSDATGWIIGHPGHYFGVIAAVFDATWTEYSVTFGPGQARSIPSNAVEMALLGLLARDGTVETTVSLRDYAVYEGTAPRHQLANDATWEWSQTAAWCIAHYLMTYRRVTESGIDWPSFIASAQFDEELVDIPGGTEPRFTCNGAVSLGAPHRDNLAALVSSCDGKLSYSQGKWKLRPSKWEAPSLTLTESHFLSIQVRSDAPTSERFNAVRGVYIDPARQYQRVEFPHVESAEYLERDDGEPIEYDLELPMTNSATMSQRIGYRQLEQGDNQTIVQGTLNKIGALVDIGDVVELDLPRYGWSEGGNLIPLSEDYSTFSQVFTTLTENAELSPFGTADAARIETDPGQSPIVLRTIAGVGDSRGLTFAVYVRHISSGSVVRLGLVNMSNFPIDTSIELDLEDGSYTRLSGSGQVHVHNLGLGYYRVVIWLSEGVSDGDDIRLTLTGDGSDSIDGYVVAVWGLQLVGGLHVDPFYVPAPVLAVATAPKTFRCVEWTRQSNGSFGVVLREDDEGDYADPLVGEYRDPATGEVALPADFVPAPSSPSATGVLGGVRIDWTDPASRLYDVIEVWVSESNNRDAAVLQATVKNSPFLDAFSYGGRQRYYWLRARNYKGVVSEFEPNTLTTAVAARPTVGGGANILADPDFELSNAFGDYYTAIVKPGDGEVFPGSAVLNQNGGANNTKYMAIQTGDGLVAAVEISTSPQGRFRLNASVLEFSIRYRTAGASSVDYLEIRAVGYDAATGGTVQNTFTTQWTLPGTSGAWSVLRNSVDVTGGDNSQFYEINLQLVKAVGSVQAIDIDSVFVFPTG